MVKEYGIYQQGAMFTREDFDPYKTVTYLAEDFGIEIPEKFKEEIKKNELTDEGLDYLCKAFCIKPCNRTLECFVSTMLTSVLLHDIVVDDSKYTKFQNDSVYASYHTDIVGEFMFDDEDKPHQNIDGDCLMVCFYVPCVWDMKDADIPADKYMASLRIKDAVKDFLKDDINWEERLGELYASGYDT